jgi:predicted dehydrogenase
MMRSSSGAALNVGLIGCGYVTRDRHLPALKRTPHLRVIAVADLDSAAASDVAQRWGVTCYTDADQLLADGAVEAVAVCVPPAAHVEVAVAALQAGKHVLVEKPLALSLADADRLIEEADGTPSRVLMGFNLRWHALIRQARKALIEGVVGKVVQIRTTFSDPLILRDKVPPWRVDRRLGGGALLDKAVHHFDLWRFLLDDEVDEVFALSRSTHGEDDAVTVTARMSGGALATALAADTTSIHNEVTIFGEAGELNVSCYRFDGLTVTSVAELPGSPRARMRNLARAAGQFGSSLRLARRGGIFAGSYDAEWRHFADVVRGGAEPECRLDDGREALAIALAAAESAASGHPVEVANAPNAVMPVRGIPDEEIVSP